jgi:hypothetical protein
VFVAEDAVTEPAAESGDLPPIVAEFRRALDTLAVGYGDLVTVEHYFDADPEYDPQPDDWPADHGWTTLLHPTAQGQWIKAYFDGVDQDLTLQVGEVGWFEWFDLDNIDGIVSEVSGICAGVMEGHVWEWRTRRERGCEVLAPDGRRWCVGEGRPPATLWPRWGIRPIPRQRLAGYGR